MVDFYCQLTWIWNNLKDPRLCVSEKMFSEEGRPILELGGTIPWAEVLEGRKRLGRGSKLDTRTHFSSNSHAFIFVMDQSLPNVSSEKPFSLGCCRCWVTLGRKVPGTFISPWSWVNVEPKTYADHRLCRRRESTLKGRERTERRAHSVLNTSKTPHDHHRKINLKYELKLAWFPRVLRFSHGFEVDFEAEQLECMKVVRFCKSNSPLRN